MTMPHIFQRFSKKELSSRPRITEADADPTLARRSVFTVSGELGSINLFSIAIPILIESVLSSMIGFINSAVLSGYSDSAVAATGTAATVLNILAILVTVISTGASVVISNYIGANHASGASKTCSVSLCVCTGIGLLLSVLSFLLAHPLMLWMNLDGEVLSLAITYFKIRSAFFFLSMISGILNAILRCYGYSKLTVISGFTTIFCNLVLNIYVIRFPSYAPLTGVEGIAVGSVISQVLGLLLSALFLKSKGISFLRPDTLSDGATYAKRILRIGIPSGISTGAYSLSQALTASFVALIGMSAVSAKVYFGNIVLYSYLFSMCFGSANSLLIGRLVGAKNFEHAKKLNRALVKLTCLVNLSISLAIILLRRPLLMIFTDSEEIIAISLAIFLIDLVAEQARAVSQVYEYALRGVGDMRFMMIVTTVSCWLFGVGLAYVLSIPAGMGLVGCWLGMTLDESVRAIASYVRWKKGKWMTLTPLK